MIDLYPAKANMDALPYQLNIAFFFCVGLHCLVIAVVSVRLYLNPKVNFSKVKQQVGIIINNQIRF
jgi:hypothetical protein